MESQQTNLHSTEKRETQHSPLKSSTKPIIFGNLCSKNRFLVMKFPGKFRFLQNSVQNSLIKINFILSKAQILLWSIRRFLLLMIRQMKHLQQQLKVVMFKPFPTQVCFLLNNLKRTTWITLKFLYHSSWHLALYYTWFEIMRQVTQLTAPNLIRSVIAL